MNRNGLEPVFTEHSYSALAKYLLHIPFGCLRRVSHARYKRASRYTHLANVGDEGWSEARAARARQRYTFSLSFTEIG